METTFRISRPELAERLRHQAWRFEFFQAVRLLSRFDQQEGGRGPHFKLGTDTSPADEPVRFRSEPSLGFPGSDVVEQNVTPNQPMSEMVVSFLGLTGPAGVLPDHYTRTLAEATRDGNASMYDFFDLFQHRLVSLFYRSWEKYRADISWEGAASGDQRDVFTGSLFSLAGVYPESSRDRLHADDSAIAFYSGHFSSHVRSATDLGSLLSDYFDLPVDVEQFCGQWLYLSNEDTSQLPMLQLGGEPGRYHTLGQDFVLGNRIRDIQSKFRLRLGPLTYEQFMRFLPVGDACRTLTDLVLLYAGNDQDFDLQPVLKAEEVPVMRLDSKATSPMYLGWNTWLNSEGITVDPTNAIFSPTLTEADRAA
ncbi:MAG: type VI secretion system baseplate subunit TssG [Planctomycetaceae bacterium]